MSKRAGRDRQVRRHYAKALNRLEVTDPSAADAVVAYMGRLVDRIIALKQADRGDTAPAVMSNSDQSLFAAACREHKWSGRSKSTSGEAQLDLDRHVADAHRS